MKKLVLITLTALSLNAVASQEPRQEDNQVKVSISLAPSKLEKGLKARQDYNAKKGPSKGGMLTLSGMTGTGAATSIAEARLQAHPVLIDSLSLGGTGLMTSGMIQASAEDEQE